MIKQKNRSGTSQDDKLLAALQPDYVSVEERSITDLLKYVREYANKVRFYNETNQAGGFWTSFLEFTDNELLELAQFAENPELFKEDAKRLLKYSEPHLAVLMTFLKLLQYPKDKFAQLTEEKVNIFYRNILKLEEKEEVPDQVHVIFSLARDVREHLLKKGTLLYAGKDNTGVDLHYEVTEDIVLNNAEVSDIKTIHFDKTITDIKSVHQNNNKGDTGFEKILCLALGDVSGLPPYYNAQGNLIPVDGKYLRTELYQRVKGKEKDELEASDANYIFKSLCFRSLKDFMYCLGLYYRETNRGYVGVIYPEDWEWEKVYTILGEVHKERIARGRRLELKEIHKENGFEAMMEFAFGEPEPWNMLYKMPENINTLEELAQAKNEAARKYIENKLCMTTDDFKVIMDKKDVALSSIAGDEVYTLLETAWTQKRGYRYPEIGSDKIVGYYADTIISADQPSSIRRFTTFGNSQTESPEPVNMGFALSSPLLNLQEGNRKIEIVISCKEGSIDYDNISALLAKNKNIFNTYLSVKNGWQETDNVDFEVGKFIIKPELKTYSRDCSYLVCDTLEYSLFDTACVDKYLVFTNSKVYKIAKFDRKNTKIFLKAVHLKCPVDTNSLINRLTPKSFVSELLEELDIPEYYTGIVRTDKENFSEYHQGKYFLDNKGKIFIINKFIEAKVVEVAYCGSIKTEIPNELGEKELLMINKVWEMIEPEYEEIAAYNDISDLTITGISSAEEQFTFEVADSVLKVTYPEGKTAQDLFDAWEAWKDNPLNDQGRYEIQKTGQAAWAISPVTKELEKTGEMIKRYESVSDKGLRVTYRGRPKDNVNLAIEAPSVGTNLADFLISGDTLTITPGKNSRTANQIAADWHLWLKKGKNDPKGFRIESKDDRLWEAVSVSQVELTCLNKQVKKCEIMNSYGVGIRVWYTGPQADQPTLLLIENTIDLFEFEIAEGQKLTIKYPSASTTSANDLVESWREWKESPLNDSGNFDIELLGDGLWTIQARTERELQPSENGIIECTLKKANIVARYKLSDDYENAIVEFIQNKEVNGQTSPGFSFSFSDTIDNNLKTKKLTINYPPLPGNENPIIQEEFQIRHVQELLSKWNREYKKYGFTLIRKSDNAMWDKEPDTPLHYNFRTDLNYIATINPDGFVVKYKPGKAIEGTPYTKLPKAKVVIHENETESDSFVFQLTNDYPGNLKILFVKYPTTKENRTVANLLKAWGEKEQLLQDILAEFDLEQSGTGKWEITGVSETKLSSNFRDEVKYFGTVDPDGFIVKYEPANLVMDSQFTKIPKAKVVLRENDSDTFAFALTNDYSNNLKVLFIEYPTGVNNRKVDKLLAAWGNEAGSLLETDSLYWKADGVLREFQLEPLGTGMWEITGKITDLSEIELRTVLVNANTELTDPCSQRFFEYKTSDVYGFTVSYAGPAGVSPQVTIEANMNDTYEITATFSHDEIFDQYVGESLLIKYPKRADKRSIVALLTAWHDYKQSITGINNYLLGFEITDTSQVVEKRCESRLLSTGDMVREYRAGDTNGICISYTGHRDDPGLEIAPIIDFTDDNVGKKVLWDNGEVFTITGRLDSCNVTVEKEPDDIQCFGAIKLYEDDAIRFETLKFTIKLDGEFPAVVPSLTENFSAEPAVKILLDNNKNGNYEEQDAVFYEYFKSICLQRIDIKVTVTGLNSINMRGNIAMINPANAFNPFGWTPEAPARFYFANREICEKRLDSLDINLNWAETEFVTGDGLPDMEHYYFAYSHSGLDKVGTIKNRDFEVKLHFLDRRTWIPISETPQTLFNHGLSYHDFTNQTYQGVIFSGNQDIPKDPLDWPRYYKLELSNQGFMKEIHQELMNETARATNSMAAFQSNYSVIGQEIKSREEQIKAAKRAEAEARGKGESFYTQVIPEARELPLIPENDRDISSFTLNAPYTPVLRSMSIDYTASATIQLDTTAGSDNITGVPVKLYRFHPFGFEEMGRPVDPDDFLLPQYNMKGYLFLGIRNLSPLQTVSLLVQMVSGSGDVNLNMPAITWSYLSSNQWIPFKQSEILKDKTFGLQNTGIIRLSIPAEATLSNTILPGDRCWICAAAPDNIAAVPDTLDIKAESVCVTYYNRNNDPDHLAAPLAAYTIKELAERDPAIKEIIQPYTSFNGKRREQGVEYFIRVSELLKHKNRALTLDDYEKLILAKFPQIYKVKCVPQNECMRPGSELLVPEARGEVIIIVILKNSNSVPFFPLKPKTPANIMEEIKRYIQSYMPPLVNVTVRNPRFEEIKYRLAVKFKEGYDQGYYINILNEDIKRFLSPWAYDKDAEITFGSSVYSSSVINFIENMNYVDYVANFSLLQQIIQHETYTEVIPLFLTEDNAAATKYSDSILVSAESHIIDVITTETYDPGAFNGIGHMRIGTDFWISRPGPVFSVGIGEMELEAWPVLRYAFANIPGAYFSSGDSRQIWSILQEAGYIDNTGNVLSKLDFNTDDPQIMVSGGQSLVVYVNTTFGLQNGEEIKDAVIDILEDGWYGAVPISADIFTTVPGTISRKISQQIWDTLKISGFIDDKGNVLPKIDLDIADSEMIVTAGRSLEYFLENTFELQNVQAIKAAVVDILRAGLSETAPILRSAFEDIPEADFSPEDSLRIWNILQAAGYFDNNGKVLTKTNLDVENPSIIVPMEQSFEDYLRNTLKFVNTQEIKAAVIDILRAGLNFGGISQYPFIVY